MIATNRADAARTLTYRFFDLPHVTRIEIAQELGLYSNEDEGLRDAELLERIFQRANLKKLLAALWNLIEKHHDDGRNLPNPFAD